MSHTFENQVLTALIQNLSPKRENLLSCLEELNANLPFLSNEVMHAVACHFNLSETEVYSVASYYHLLDVKPVGRIVLRLCQSISCELAGKDEVVTALEGELGISMGETTADKLFTLHYANCMGSCHRGPAMLVGEELYDELTAEKVVDIVNLYRKQVSNV